MGNIAVTFFACGAFMVIADYATNHGVLPKYTSELRSREKIIAQLGRQTALLEEIKDLFK